MTEEGQHVKKSGLLVAALLVAIPLVLLAAGCGGGGSGGGGSEATALPSAGCEPIQYEGSGKPEALIASDLPLQGSNRALTTEMAQAVEFILKQHDWKAGGKNIGFQSCDNSTAQAGSWDSAKCTANARAYANNTAVIGVDRDVQLGLREARDPDRRPRAGRSDRVRQPGEHVSGPDDQRAGHRVG